MNTIEYLNKLPVRSLPTIRSALYTLSVKTGYDQTGRIILFPESRGANVIGRINHESNGLVVRLVNNQVKCLAVPMPYLRNANQMSADSIVSEWTEDTHVYPCREGTNITMYWFAEDEKSEGRWCIATAKGIELNNVKWNGKKTYQEMVYDCVNYSIGQDTWGEYSDWDAFCKDLDKTCSYAFGFWHPDFHVFENQMAQIWINRVTCNETGIDVTSECKLPFDIVKPLEFKDQTHDQIIDHLQKTCNNALGDHLDYDDRLLGYIIRNLKHGDVLFESTLLTTINDLYYNADHTKSISQTSYNRHNYTLLHNYVNGNNELFMDVFPRFMEDFMKFDSDILKLLDAFELLYRKEKQSVEVPLTDKYLQIASEIKKNIDKLIKVNVDDKTFKTTVMAVLYHSEHFDALYRLLF